LILPFLAMAELKQASFCSSGLAKWFHKRTPKFLADSSPFPSVFSRTKNRIPMAGAKLQNQRESND
jgi:hypothetical protein